ncbi:MAG: tRNA pseudouridine synthase, partial [bacterium]|nr:tRNA pseudouridine synthase [bacterium]
VGHAGTLDPMATGVLPVCVGEATKLVPFLMAGDKVYEAEACLGVTTDTLDATGTVLLERDAAHITQEAIETALRGFVGTISQVPPMHSAIRVDGKRLYELAREGKEVDREPRQVRITEARLDGFAPGGRPLVRFTVGCGKGTYIRSLAGDLGELLGVGAHLTALRRTRVGGFAIENAVPLDALGPTTPCAGLVEALGDLPTLSLTDRQARDVRDGKLKVIGDLPVPDATEEGGFVRLLRPDGSLLAVSELASGRLRLCRVFTLTIDANS